MARRPAPDRAPLSRERIIEAAFVLADEGGASAITMQAVAHRLGAEAMSLYRHVRNKEDLLDGLTDLVFAEIDVPEGRADWRSALRDRSLSARAALRRHAWAIGLMESRLAPGPANLRSHDRTLRILVDAGFSPATATHAYNLLDCYILGFALQESAMPFTSADELAAMGDDLLAQVPEAEYPTLAHVARELLGSGFDYAAEFEVGLDLILDGIERMRAAPPA